MRYNEIQLTEDRAKEIIAKKYPHYTQEQIDEAVPAMLGAVAGAAGKLAMKGAAAAGKMAAKGAGAVAKAGAKGIGRVGQKMGQMAAKGAKGAAQKLATKAVNKAQGMVANKMAQAVLKPGATLPMPDAKGQQQDFEIDSVKGNEVTLKNPKAKPGEPIKTVHVKKDLDPIIKQMTTG